MSVIDFQRSTFAKTCKVDPAPREQQALYQPQFDVVAGAESDDLRNEMFAARCRQVAAMRLANNATNTVFARLRTAPKRRRLLSA